MEDQQPLLDNRSSDEEEIILNRRNLIPPTPPNSNSPDIELGSLSPKMCRICFDDEEDPNDPDERFFSPCRCTGTNKYVHRGCLNTWRATARNPEAFKRCFTCNYQYRY